MLILIVIEIKNIKTIVYLDMVYMYIILYPFNIFFVPIRMNTGRP